VGPEPTEPTAAGPAVVALDDPAALDPARAGAKAANLARAAVAGLPVVDGVVLTAAAGDPDSGRAAEALRTAWKRWGPDVALVVRSSSTLEDATDTALAGQFRSVLDVRGWDALVHAAREVRASARDVVRLGRERGPMAVLIQQQIDAACGGVLFTVDPVSGDRHRIVVDVVAGTPAALVSGRVTATHLVLSRRGRVLERAGPPDDVPLTGAHRRALTRLAHRAEATFGAPQDIEWAVDHDGRLWLLQSRPITAVADPPTGPVLGAGPIAETLPETVSPIEEDLWVAPLREAITIALRATGAASARARRRSPVLTVVAGRPAVDLELLGIHRRGSRVRAFFDPRPPLRRLAAAWRVGRLRVALGALDETIVALVDEHLSAVAPLPSLDDTELVHLVTAGRQELTTLQAYEMLTGMLEPDPAGRPPLGAVALAALASARAAGAEDDDAVVAAEPVVLTLTRPRFAEREPLPRAVTPVNRELVAGSTGSGAVDALGHRDALRWRARLVQELLGLAAEELAGRLADRKVIASVAEVRAWRLDDLFQAVGTGQVPAPALRASPVGPPLPDRFRLTARGCPIAEPAAVGSPAGAGLPAGGGRAGGRVVHGPVSALPPGSVLVVEHLEPHLAAHLGALAALVAETGSPLAHLAIMAREVGVATVVGVTGARERFPAGVRVVVDGTTGEVAVVDTEDPR
jgi:pyruvate,water dikinase